MLNKSGEGYVQVCVLILVLCLIVSVLLTLIYAVNFVRQTERNIKTVLENYVTANSIRIYNSIKQGTNETEAIDEDEFIDNLCGFASFTRGNTYLYHSSGGEEADYYITVPKVRFAEHNKLRLVVTCKVFIPLRFLENLVTTAEAPLTVKLNLEGKF